MDEVCEKCRSVVKEVVPVTLNVQDGDVITSKKGILMQSPLTGNKYLVKKVKVRGEGFEVLSDKEEVNGK